MARVFAKWLIKTTDRIGLLDSVADSGFYIQVFQTEESDNSNTIYSDDANTRVVPTKNPGIFEVYLEDEADGPILSPGFDDEADFEAIDFKGKEIGEAVDFGEVK